MLLHYLAKFKKNKIKAKQKLTNFNDKCYKNITVMIYLIFMQYMKHRMHITQERLGHDLMTNSMKFTQQLTPPLSENDSSVCK